MADEKNNMEISWVGLGVVKLGLVDTYSLDTKEHTVVVAEVVVSMEMFLKVNIKDLTDLGVNDTI